MTSSTSDSVISSKGSLLYENKNPYEEGGCYWNGDAYCNMGAFQQTHIQRGHYSKEDTKKNHNRIKKLLTWLL